MRDWAKRVISGLEHTHYWGAYDEVQEIGDEHVRGIIAELVHVVKEVPGSQLCNARGAPRIRPLLARLRLPEFTEEMRESGPAYWLLERAGLVPLVHPVEYRWSRLAEEEGEAIEDTAPIPEPEPEAPPIPEADRELLAEIVADLRQIEDMSADGSANAGGIHAVVYGLQVRADDLTNPAAWSELHPADRVALEGCGIVPAVVRRAQRQAGRAAGAVA
jgi:hypothetical protein